MNNKINLILKISEWSIFLVLMGMALLILSPYLPTKQQLSTYVVGSGSMEPEIKTASIAVVTARNLSSVKSGDVISFTSPMDSKQIIIHRVVKINEVGNYITKGDNNASEDPWVVSKSAVKGKFITSLPYLGYLAMYIKQPLYFAIIIGIPALIFSILQILKIRKGIQEEIEKRTKLAISSRSVHSIAIKDDG